MFKVSQEFCTNIRVIYADTDQMGIVYHAKYLEYFEIGRNEMLREIGFPYKFLEKNNVYLPVIEAHLNYCRPAKYDDLLLIKTIVKREETKSLRVYIHCSIFVENQLMANGYTVHVTSNSLGKPARVPKEIQVPLFERLFS